MAEKFRLVYKFRKGWEPQIRYCAGCADGMFWYPLGPDGLWLEPDAYNHGRITLHNYFPRFRAKQIIKRATAINHVLALSFCKGNSSTVQEGDK